MRTESSEEPVPSEKEGMLSMCCWGEQMQFGWGGWLCFCCGGGVGGFGCCVFLGWVLFVGGFGCVFTGRCSGLGGDSDLAKTHAGQGNARQVRWAPPLRPVPLSRVALETANRSPDIQRARAVGRDGET